MKKLVILWSIILLLSLPLVSIIGCQQQPAPVTPTPTPTVTPGTGESVTINLSAENIAFDKSTIRVPAGADVTVVFDNRDSIPHNLAIYETKAATKAIFVGEIITGPRIITYRFTAPSTPLIYFFQCDVHPSGMTGTFIIYGTTS